VVYNHKLRRRDHKLIYPHKWILRPEVEARLVMVEEVWWDRGSTHNHEKSMLWAQSERLFVLRRPEDEYKFDNRAEKLSDIWRINRPSKKEQTEKANGHPAAFPEALVELVIKLWSPPGGLVCDPFSGSGTTGAVAKRMGRHFEGAELMEEYHGPAAQRIAEAASFGVDRVDVPSPHWKEAQDE